MNFQLSEQQKLLQESILSVAGKLNGAHSFETRWKTLAGTGIIGTCVAADFDGMGLGALDMLLVLESLGLGNSDNGLSFALAAHTLACVIPIHKFGSSEQKQKYLPSLINGDVIAANAMTESVSGSDVFNIESKAVKNNNGYLLNGSKVFISNSEIARLVLTYASTNKEKGFYGGITAFIVGENNFTRGSQFRKMGLESCSLGEIHFNDSNLSDSEVLGKEGSGAMIFNYSMEWERICLTGIHLGAMQRVLNKTLEFVKQRKSQGQSIGKFQGISHMLAEMQTSLEVARTYAYKTAWMLENNKTVSKEAAIAKLFVSNTVRNFMIQAMQIFGGYGYIADYGIEQEVRDALAATIYSGTSEVQKNIIASNLGL